MTTLHLFLNFEFNDVISFPFNPFQTYLKMLNHVRPIWQKQLRENTKVVICFLLLYHQILHLYLSRLNYCHFCHYFLKNKIHSMSQILIKKKILIFILVCHFDFMYIDVLFYTLWQAQWDMSKKQSYEIKSPPWTILWFRILGIFSVENIARLGVFMFQTSDNSQLCIDSQYSSQ